MPKADDPQPMRSQPDTTRRVDLLAIALGGFDAFVPRKLVRMVELLHQMADIARRRQRPLRFDSGSEVDVRIVLALAMIQLFQPELYRILRRRVESFPSLLTAFIGEFNPDKQKFVAPASVDAHLSSIDLGRWAIDAAAFNASATKAPVPAPDTPPALIEWSPLAGETEYHFAVSQIAKRHASDRTARANAQLVRLPIVAQIVEHRAAQRHVFDVLKLMRALAESFAAFAPSERALKFAPYLSLLAEQPPTQILCASGVSMGEFSSAELIISQLVGKRIDVVALADDLLSRESATQANLVTRHALSAGEKISSEMLTHLATELKQRLDRFREIDTYDKDRIRTELRTEQRRLLTGLQFLAPYVDPADGGSLWALVRNSVGWRDPDISDERIEPKLRALWGDVRSAFGCDDRFDAKNFYLLKDRFKAHDERIEPIPGFVLVPAGEFVMGHEADKSNPPQKADIAAPFYISRTLVTVDQFALFLEGGAKVTETKITGIDWEPLGAMTKRWCGASTR